MRETAQTPAARTARPRLPTNHAMLLEPSVGAPPVCGRLLGVGVAVGAVVGDTVGDGDGVGVGVAMVIEPLLAVHVRAAPVVSEQLVTATVTGEVPSVLPAVNSMLMISPVSAAVLATAHLAGL